MAHSPKLKLITIVRKGNHKRSWWAGLYDIRRPENCSSANVKIPLRLVNKLAAHDNRQLTTNLFNQRKNFRRWRHVGGQKYVPVSSKCISPNEQRMKRPLSQRRG